MKTQTKGRLSLQKQEQDKWNFSFLPGKQDAGASVQHQSVLTATAETA